MLGILSSNASFFLNGFYVMSVRADIPYMVIWVHPAVLKFPI